MALSHRDLALNQNVISIVDDTVENGIGDGAFTLMAWINTLVLCLYHFARIFPKICFFSVS